MSWSSTVSGLSPTSCWKLSETSSTFADSGSANKPGTAGSGITRGVAGLGGDLTAGVSFAGTANDYIDFGDNDDLNGGSYSILAAIKFDGTNNTNYRRIVSKMAASDGFEVGLFKSADTPSNGIYFDHKVSGTNKEASSAALSNNTTYLVVCVYDTSADTMKIYVNGSQSGSTLTSVTSDLADNTAALTIGNSKDHLLAAAFGGTIDEVALWKGTALSSTNVSNLWSAFNIFAPDTPTVGSGTVGTYGQVTFSVTDAGTGGPSSSVSVVERSSDGGTTWADITSSCTITGSSSPYTVVDGRPTLGSQSIAIGGNAKYRVKVTNVTGTSGYSSNLSVSSVTYTASTIIDSYCSTSHTYQAARADTQSIGITGYVDYDYTVYGELQICEWLMAMAYAYYRTGTSSYLTDCQNQWTYIKSVATSLTGDRFILLPDLPTTPTPDRSLRPILHAMIAARLLDFSTNGTAATLAAEIRSKCDSWGAYYFDNAPTGSTAFTQFNANSQTAWQSSHAYSVGDLVRPTTGNGHGYRCYTAGTSGGSEPTWSTTAGATVSDG
mgnify:FL=1